MRDFENEIYVNKSAIFMIVLRGNFSEGHNFKDELCRGLIVIGQPYPPIEGKLELKKKLMGK